MTALEGKSSLWVRLGLIGGCVALAILCGFLAGKSCGPTVVVPEPVGIDAGPGDDEIARRRDEALRAEQEKIRQLEKAHADDMARFDSEQRQEYEQVKKQGRAAVARWLTGFNRTLRDGGR